MRKLCHLIIIALPTILAGCTPTTAPSWYSRIEPHPSTQPRDAQREEANAPRSDFANQEFQRPLSRNDAFAILLNTETFAHSYIGFEGRKSNQVDAFQVILDQPDAFDAFTDLLHRAHTAGQLYALCGLRLLASEKYAQAEAPFLQSDERVDERYGCITSACSVRELVRSSDPYAVRLLPGETIEQWQARTKPPGEGIVCDISGGATPVTFRDAK